MSENITINSNELELNKQDLEDIINIAKQENPNSILSSLNDELIADYINIALKSSNIFVCTYKKNNKVIGYAILSKKPIYLFSEFFELKYKILFSLIKNINIKALLNICLSILKIDLILIPLKKKKIIIENLNLNMLAIDKLFQSKGLGTKFINSVVLEINKKQEYKAITVETFDERSIKFYKDKLKFNELGKKIRLNKNLIILYKNL